MTSVTVVYAHSTDPYGEALARNYVTSVLDGGAAGHPHRNLVVSDHRLSADMRTLFDQLPNVTYVARRHATDAIAVFALAASLVRDEMIVCFDRSTRVGATGWLRRMVEAWNTHGPGVYGALSGGFPRRHLLATGFWCAPAHLRAYASTIPAPLGHDEFERGRCSFWSWAESQRLPVSLVTWSGVHPRAEWRTPPDISCRGTQANCLVTSRVNAQYDRARANDPERRIAMELRADGWPGAAPTLTLVYIHVVGDQAHVAHAQRFLESYRAFPPGATHDTIVLCNGRPPDRRTRALFRGLPGVRFVTHDDSGWDIGGYVAASRHTTADIMLCLGGTAYVRRAGWMRRMLDAWTTHGPGIYGSLASYEVSPHFNTTGFWCPPRLLAAYPFAVRTKADRYAFEHGKPHLSMGAVIEGTGERRLFWRRVHDAGLPAKLVTWDGEYDWWDWRTPRDIFRRGDQSNCLTCWHHVDAFAQTADARAIWAAYSDTLTDEDYDIVSRTIGRGRANRARVLGLPRRWDQPEWIEYFAALGRAVAQTLAPRRVLHLGCGEGFLVDALRSLGVDAEGIDVSPAAIAAAPSRVRRHCRTPGSASRDERPYDLGVYFGEANVHAPADLRTLLGPVAARVRQVLFIPMTDEGSVTADGSGTERDDTFSEWGFFRDRHYAPGEALPGAHRFGRVTATELSILVVSAEAPGSPVLHRRIVSPLTSLAASPDIRWRIARPDKALPLAECNLVVLQREAALGARAKAIVDRAHALGLPVLFELDDALPGTSIDDMECVLRDADFVTVPTDQMRRCLLEAFPGVPGRVDVVADCVDTAVWGTREPRTGSTSAPVVACLVGDPADVEDTGAIDGIRELVAQGVRVDVWGQMPASLAALSGARFAGDMRDYVAYARQRRARRCDFAIVPFRERASGPLSSDMAWLENALLGVAGLYSAVAPFSDSVDHGRTGWLVRNDAASWRAAIELLRADHALCRTLAREARQEVRGTRCDDTRQIRLDALYRSFQASGRKPEPPGGQRPRKAVVSPVDRAWSHANILERLRRYPEAADAYAAVAEAGGSFAALAAYRLGSLLKREGRSSESEAWFRVVASGASAPDTLRAGAHFHLGEIARGTDQLGRAAAAYRAALRLNAGHKAARAALDEVERRSETRPARGRARTSEAP